MSSSSSSKPISKKRKLSEARSIPNHEERDKQIAEFWSKNSEAAEHSCVRIKAGKIYSYPAMVTSAERSSEPPAEDAAEGVWIEKGWVLRNEKLLSDWWALRAKPVCT
jgi:hypothetical protein